MSMTCGVWFSQNGSYTYLPIHHMCIGTNQPEAEDSRQILGRVSVKSLLDMSLDGMEVWGVTEEVAVKPSGEQKKDGESRRRLDGEEEAAPPAASPAWGTLANYLSGNLNPSALISPVYTGTSLHYRYVSGSCQ